MSKVYLIIMSVLTVAGIGSTAYIGKEYSAKKAELAVCEETVSKQKEQLSTNMTESQSLAERLTQANRQREASSQRVAEIEKRIVEFQNDKTKSNAEMKSLLDKLSEARRLYDDNLRKVEELTRKIAEFEEQEKKYQALIEGLKNEMHSKEITISQFQERLKIELVNQVLFGNGSTQITSSGQQVLSHVATVLKDLKENFIFVIGHTDCVPIGQDLLPLFPSNWELSSARSASVVRYLVDKGGVDPKRCVVVGRSFYTPQAPNDTEEGRCKNRRAEIIIARSLEFVRSDADSAEASPSGSNAVEGNAN